MSDETRSLCVIACGMIAREVLDVCRINSLDHITLRCLPAEYHHFPEKIAPAADIAIQKARDDGFSEVFVGYADCGTGGKLDEVCEKHGVERIAGPHCFSFYIGNDLFAQEGDDHLRTFFMTDFLARHFDTFMLRPLGLDRYPELLETYFGHYERLLYIAQTDDHQLLINARAAALRLGLKFEHRFTGFGDLESALSRV